MFKGKKYIFTVFFMLVISMVSLLFVSALTYLFKWQSDKANIGIIVTYVIAGAAGGLCLRDRNQKSIQRKLIQALIVSMMYLFIILVSSILFMEEPFGLSHRVWLIYFLVTSSVFGATL